MDMPQYAILIYTDEAALANMSQHEFGQVLQEHKAFGAKHGAVLRGGSGLELTDTATSLRQDSSGGLLVTDGAFVETKEALGGYYIIDAKDLDEAIEVAKQVPARYGGVEIRPLRVVG
jgi:hypothetical protein